MSKELQKKLFEERIIWNWNVSDEPKLKWNLI